MTEHDKRTAMTAGNEAYRAGEALTSNPFEAGSDLAEDWRFGWNLGERAEFEREQMERAGAPVDARSAPGERAPTMTHAAKTHPDD